MEKINKIFTVVGRKGSGKSHLVSNIVEKYYYESVKEHIVIIDNSADYITDKGLDFLTHVKIDRRMKPGTIDWKKLIKTQEYLLMEFHGVLKDQREKLVNEILRAITEIKETLVVTDECHLFFTKNSPAEEYERLITGGRHERIDQIYVTQMVQKINLDCLSQADIIATFREQEFNALKRLAFYMGVAKKEIQELEKYQALVKYGSKVEKIQNDDIIII